MKISRASTYGIVSLTSLSLAAQEPPAKRIVAVSTDRGERDPEAPLLACGK